MIIEQLYDALLEAGASEAKAREASRAVADFETKLTAVLPELKQPEVWKSLIHAVEARLQDVQSDVRLLKWVVIGFNTPMLAAILFKIFSK
jgi:capsule polysaccharide export protein KpsE/RkpR